MSAKLKGKVAIVTGASSGIGMAIAEALANHGAKVGLLARRLDRLKALKEKIQSKGGEAVIVQCDVSNREQVFKAVDTVKKSCGTIDILVNNAGIANPTMTYNCRVDEWLQVVDVNVIGTLHCYAATLQDMIDKKSGHIINISSIAGRGTIGATSAYGGSKHFMQGHSAGIRLELAPLGIKVTVLQPGLTKTEILQPSTDEDVAKYYASIPKCANLFNEVLLESEDVADAAIFALVQHDRVGINEIMVEPKSVVFNSS